MSAHQPHEPTARSLDNRLALERTRIAFDHTAMAGLRTGASMITFGCSVEKFVGLELATSDGAASVIGLREFGMTLIIIGILSLMAGRFDQQRDLRLLNLHCPGMPLSGTRVVEARVGGPGTLAPVAVILRM